MDRQQHQQDARAAQQSDGIQAARKVGQHCSTGESQQKQQHPEFAQASDHALPRSRAPQGEVEHRVGEGAEHQPIPQPGSQAQRGAWGVEQHPSCDIVQVRVHAIDGPEGEQGGEHGQHRDRRQPARSLPVAPLRPGEQVACAQVSGIVIHDSAEVLNGFGLLGGAQGGEGAHPMEFMCVSSKLRRPVNVHEDELR